MTRDAPHPAVLRSRGRGARSATLDADAFSVVICTHSERRWADLERAVESVRAQTLRPREIVLVVDHNPDLLQRTRERWPDLAVVENEQPHGLSGARNTGIEQSRGNLIAFLDDDAVAETNWLEATAGAFARNGVIGVGGAVEPTWVAGRPSWFPEEFDWVVGCTYAGLPSRRAAVRNVIGANMSFRREVFEQIGGFRGEIGRVGSKPLGCEETELCIRARQRWPQRVILHDPAVRVSHTVPAERARWRYFLSRCYAEGRSKAVVAELAGAPAALSSELAYSVRVLPTAVLRALRDAALRGDAAALARAGTIVAGFTVTAAGFVAGRLAARRSPGPAP